MNLSEKDIIILKRISLVAGIFAILISLTIIFGYVQLQRLKPLENPVLVTLKEQFDKNPQDEDLKEQIRSLDLVARKAYFTSQWQINTGSFLLLLSALVFIISQRMIAGTIKKIPEFPGDVKDELMAKKVKRNYLQVSGAVILVIAIVISFFLRNILPDPIPVKDEAIAKSIGSVNVNPNLNSPQVIENIAIDVSPSEGQDLAPVSEQVVKENEPSTPVTPASGVESGDIFPFFRGIGSRGFAPTGSYSTSWDGSSGKNILWKTKVPGEGFSSPIIWENKLFLTGTDGTSEEIHCFSTNGGELLWTLVGENIPGSPENLPEEPAYTGYAAPTAATNGKVVCAIYATGDIICADFAGNTIWAKNIEVPVNHYGHSSSLIIYNDLLLVQFDHYDKASVKALDINTGTQVWETPRPVKISWASPVIASINGIDQLILNSDPLIIAYNPSTGQELWRVRGLSAEIGPSLAFNGKMVFAGNEYAKLIAINPGAGASIAWEDNEYTPDIASPVATEEYLFVATANGDVACYTTESGELLWDTYFDYGFESSPIISGDNIYFLDLSGVMYIVKVSGEFELVGKSALGEKVRSTPAFAGDKIFIRGLEHLYCITDTN